MPAEGPNPPPFDEPGQSSLTLAQAAAILGVNHFNWIQQITYTPPTLQPVTFKNLESGYYVKVTAQGLRYVDLDQSGNYVIDSSTPIIAFDRSAPFVDPIVPKADANYVPNTGDNYARGFIIDNEYAYQWDVNPAPDGFFYYWNEPFTGEFDDLTPNTTAYDLDFEDFPEQPAFPDPLDPSSIISPFTSDPSVSYLGFTITLAGVIDDNSPQDYKTWASQSYTTSFTWKSNTLYNGATGIKDITTGGISGILPGWGDSNFGARPVPTSGGIFGIEPTDEVAAGTQLLLNPIPDSTGSPGQTIALAAMAQNPTEGQTLTYSLAPGTDREISASFEQEKSATEAGQPYPGREARAATSLGTLRNARSHVELGLWRGRAWRRRAGQAFELGERTWRTGPPPSSFAAGGRGPRQDGQAAKTKLLARSCLRFWTRAWGQRELAEERTGRWKSPARLQGLFKGGLDIPSTHIPFSSLRREHPIWTLDAPGRVTRWADRNLCLSSDSCLLE